MDSSWIEIKSTVPLIAHRFDGYADNPLDSWPHTCDCDWYGVLWKCGEDRAWQHWIRAGYYQAVLRDHSRLQCPLRHRWISPLPSQVTRLISSGPARRASFMQLTANWVEWCKIPSCTLLSSSSVRPLLFVWKIARCEFLPSWHFRDFSHVCDKENYRFNLIKLPHKINPPRHSFIRLKLQHKLHNQTTTIPKQQEAVKGATPFFF